MTWVILTGRQNDLDQVATPHKIITSRDYLAHPALFRAGRPKVINLSNSYAYQSRGYYASLLASSRGHKVIPTVETMIDLSEKKLYENALPELEVALNKCRKDLGGTFPARVAVFFGIGPTKAWDRFARLLFDWFRAPALEVTIKDGEWASIRKVGFLPLNRMKGDEESRFLASLDVYTSREWRDTKARTPARYTFATLVAAPLGQDRREDGGRSRADHEEGPRQARQLRRAVHPRNDLDLQPHLPLRPPRPAGRDAGDRRPAVDDPLHQQSLSQRTDDLQQGAGAADGDDRRAGRPGDRRPDTGFPAGAEDPRQRLLARRQEGL
jgi:hypothetical protein